MKHRPISTDEALEAVVRRITDNPGLVKHLDEDHGQGAADAAKNRANWRNEFSGGLMNRRWTFRCAFPAPDVLTAHVHADESRITSVRIVDESAAPADADAAAPAGGASGGAGSGTGSVSGLPAGGNAPAGAGGAGTSAPAAGGSRSQFSPEAARLAAEILQAANNADPADVEVIADACRVMLRSGGGAANGGGAGTGSTAGAPAAGGAADSAPGLTTVTIVLSGGGKLPSLSSPEADPSRAAADGLRRARNAGFGDRVIDSVVVSDASNEITYPVSNGVLEEPC